MTERRSIPERAVRIAHRFSPRCTGGKGHGPGGDGPRWHSNACAMLAAAIEMAMFEVEAETYAKAQELQRSASDIRPGDNS